MESSQAVHQLLQVSTLEVELDPRGWDELGELRPVGLPRPTPTTSRHPSSPQQLLVEILDLFVFPRKPNKVHKKKKFKADSKLIKQLRSDFQGALEKLETEELNK